MSYTLDLHFRPAVPRDRVLRYFAARKYFTIVEDKLSYQNPDTGVYFWIKLRCARNILLQRTIVSAEFEINYNRPSFFGIEGERELSAFVAPSSRGSRMPKCTAWARDLIRARAF